MATTSEADVDKEDARSGGTDHGNHRWDRQVLFGG